MQTAKQQIEAMARALPDDATFEEAQYRLYVLEKIQRGLQDIEDRGGVPHDEAEAQLAKWLRD